MLWLTSTTPTSCFTTPRTSEPIFSASITASAAVGSSRRRTLEPHMTTAPRRQPGAGHPTAGHSASSRSGHLDAESDSRALLGLASHPSGGRSPADDPESPDATALAAEEDVFAPPTARRPGRGPGTRPRCLARGSPWANGTRPARRRRGVDPRRVARHRTGS